MHTFIEYEFRFQTKTDILTSEKTWKEKWGQCSVKSSLDAVEVTEVCVYAHTTREKCDWLDCGGSNDIYAFFFVFLRQFFLKKKKNQEKIHDSKNIELYSTPLPLFSLYSKGKSNHVLFLSILIWNLLVINTWNVCH